MSKRLDRVILLRPTGETFMVYKDHRRIKRDKRKAKRAALRSTKCQH